MRVPFLRSAAVLLLAVTGASACTGWGRQGVPEPGSTRRLPDPVRVETYDHRVVVLRDAVVSADSLVGYVGRDSIGRVAVALEDVRRVEARQVNFLQTVATTTAVTLVVVVAAAFVVLASLSGG
jgi:hypothetical protein